VKEFLDSVAEPHDIVVNSRAAKRVAPVEMYLGNPPRFDGSIEVHPFADDGWFLERKPWPVTSGMLTGISYYEQIALRRVDEFLQQPLDRDPGRQDYVARQDMLHVAEAVLASVLRYHESARKQGQREGPEFDRMADGLREKLLAVRLDRLNLLADADDWDGALDLATRLADVYPKSEDRLRIARALSQIIARAAQEGNVRGLQRLEVQKRLRRLQEPLPALNAAAALGKALADPDPEVRRGAALALGELGPRAQPALPALLKALDPGENEEVRKCAAEALSNIDPNDPNVVAALVRVLAEQGNYRVRHRVVWALERLQKFEQPGVVEGLANTLLETGPDARLLRYEAAKTLALKLGPRVPGKTIDVLLEALRDNNIKIYQGTGARVSSSGTEARTGPAQVKESGFGDWRRVVAIAFARIGERARRPEVLEGLRKLSEDSFDEATRKAAKDALRVLEPMALEKEVR
jgi:HEAT repeat protein